MADLRFWIVNPEVSVSERWRRLFERQGWRVAAFDGIQALVSASSRSDVGIVLVDWACLGPSSAARTIRALKAKLDRAAFILTSADGLANDRVIELLEAGIDDYLTHDTHDNLLTAKLGAHARRLLPWIAEALDVLKAPKGDLKVDQARKEALVRGGGGRWNSLPELTPTEMDLLALFLKRPGAALDRRFIIDALWRDDGVSIRPGTIDKHVESLRRKLGKRGSRIRTIYGHGYAYKEAPATRENP